MEKLKGFFARFFVEIVRMGISASFLNIGTTFTTASWVRLGLFDVCGDDFNNDAGSSTCI